MFKEYKDVAQLVVQHLLQWQGTHLFKGITYPTWVGNSFRMEGRDYLDRGMPQHSVE
jgi:hypothetical protein